VGVQKLDAAVSDSPALDASCTGSRYKDWPNDENPTPEFRDRMAADRAVGKLRS
jgi:hypothetical protein